MARITQATWLELAKSELAALSDRGPFELLCETGALWLTCEGSRDDVVLRAGERVEIAAGRQTVVSALQPSRLSVHRRQPAAGLCIWLNGEAHAPLDRLLRWRVPALCSLIPATCLR